MSRFIGDPRQLLHRLETPDYLEHDKKDPRGEQRYDSPVKNRIHRVDALASPANVNFMARIPRSFPPKALSRRSKV